MKQLTSPKEDLALVLQSRNVELSCKTISEALKIGNTKTVPASYYQFSKYPSIRIGYSEFEQLISALAIKFNSNTFLDLDNSDYVAAKTGFLLLYDSHVTIKEFNKLLTKYKLKKVYGKFDIAEFYDDDSRLKLHSQNWYAEQKLNPNQIRVYNINGIPHYQLITDPILPYPLWITQKEPTLREIEDNGESIKELVEKWKKEHPII